MRPGDYKSRDVDGSNSYDALIDKDFIGHDKPRVRLGLRNDFSFLKNFNASFFFRADLGDIGNFRYAILESIEYYMRCGLNVHVFITTNGYNENERKY